MVIALYHDQGLAPLKAVDFDEAVNVTLGLPFVRTSPDHGTAFGIAGRGIASPRSFANAVAVARRLLALARPAARAGRPAKGSFPELGVVIPRLCRKNHATIRLSPPTD